ncbi:hypothetical protein [Petrachloros mirabilis]
MRIDIPKGLYQAIFSFFLGASFALLVMFGTNETSRRIRQTVPVPATAQFVSDSEAVKVLKAEVADVRGLNNQLLGIIAKLDPENDVLKGSIHDPHLSDYALPDESR